MLLFKPEKNKKNNKKTDHLGRDLSSLERVRKF